MMKLTREICATALTNMLTNAKKINAYDVQIFETLINNYFDIIRAYTDEYKKDVVYICDQRECDNCSNFCKHTSNIEHAKNFEKVGSIYYEKIKKEQQFKIPIRLNGLDVLKEVLENMDLSSDNKDYEAGVKDMVRSILKVIEDIK